LYKFYVDNGAVAIQDFRKYFFINFTPEGLNIIAQPKARVFLRAAGLGK
jgi:hypothetical protein